MTERAMTEETVPAEGRPAAEAASPAGAAPLSTQAKIGVAVVVACALVALFWPRSGTREAPPGLLFDAGGRQVTLGARMEEVTLVHFWATWCPPCLEEVPTLLDLSRELATEPGFTVVMIAVADDVEKVKTFLGESYRASLFDPDWKVAKRYGTDKLPETHLVVAGEIVESFIGATDWRDPGVRRRVREALERARSS